METPLLSLRGVSKTYAGPRARRVLKDVHLALRAGDYIAISGESGVGKSTLLNLIAGLDKPDSGEILFEGKDLGAMNDAARTELRRARMGFVFQAFHLLPHLTVAQNIALPLTLNRINSDAAAARVRALLEGVALGDAANAYPAELSGGELQRVAIARALAHRPALVLADEPTGNLDPETAAQVLALLKAQVRGDHAAGILVTHSPVAAASADRVYLLTPEGLVPGNP
ncbi:MAG: ABC transporter ATP-binding protein [Betaproteobacteria bacterium]|nr:ABC transporter ATP-binding protein [Betaproteobacteria bacterium]